jgi:hypothetical protein
MLWWYFNKWVQILVWDIVPFKAFPPTKGLDIAISLDVKTQNDKWIYFTFKPQSNPQSNTCNKLKLVEKAFQGMKLCISITLQEA